MGFLLKGLVILAVPLLATAAYYDISQASVGNLSLKTVVNSLIISPAFALYIIAMGWPVYAIPYLMYFIIVALIIWRHDIARWWKTKRKVPA